MVKNKKIKFDLKKYIKKFKYMDKKTERKCYHK